MITLVSGGGGNMAHHQALSPGSPRLVGQMVELLPDRLYFCSFDENARPKADAHSYYLCVDNEVHYEGFYNDFGPLNLSVLYKFCKKLSAKLKSSKKRIVFFTSPNSQKRVNGAYLIGSYLIIYHRFSAELAWSRLQKAQPPKYIGFRDAAMGPSTYDLLLTDVFSAVEKAVRFKWLDFSNFDADEYEYYERVENGDFNWILPGKFLSFCGPHNKSVVDNGYPYHAPEVYFDYFRKNNVTTIVRLNKKMYDAKRFIAAGFDHVDLFFVDGSTPSDQIMLRFIEVADKAKGAVAVHCKAGLGRTGTLIACWMMKEYGLTAAECMAWTRICRPGSVIGPQQQYLIEKQNMCWSLKDSVVDVNGNATAPKMVNGHLNHITTKVDTIRLNQQKQQLASSRSHSTIPRPSTLGTSLTVPRVRGRKSGGADADETYVDNEGNSQGDRLLHIKAIKQHNHDEEVSHHHPIRINAQQHPQKPLSVVPTSTVRFTSPTTPVKPVYAPNRPRPGASMMAGSGHHSSNVVNNNNTLPPPRPSRPTPGGGSSSPGSPQRKLQFAEPAIPASKIARVSVTTSAPGQPRYNGMHTVVRPMVPSGKTPRIVGSLRSSAASTSAVVNPHSGNALNKQRHTGSTTRLHHRHQNGPYAVPRLPSKLPSPMKLTNGGSASSTHLMSSPSSMTLKKSGLITKSSYHLRPRRSFSPPPGPELDYAATLPPNNRALLGANRDRVSAAKR